MSTTPTHEDLSTAVTRLGVGMEHLANTMQSLQNQIEKQSQISHERDEILTQKFQDLLTTQLRMQDRIENDHKSRIAEAELASKQIDRNLQRFIVWITAIGAIAIAYDFLIKHWK